MAPLDCLFFLAYCVLSANALAAAYIYGPMQEALLIRTKRDTGRSMTFSGYFPDRGMTSYATSADFEQWNRGYRRRPMYFPEEEAWNKHQENKDDGGQIELTPPKPSQTTQGSSWMKPEEEEPIKDSSDKKDVDSAPAKKPKRRKPVYHHREEEEGETEDEDVSAGSAQASTGGNAKASFNAWFPIVLGMFPQSRDDYDGYSSRRGQQQYRTTVMANSVSHGPGGVASSHAIFGSPPQRNR